MGRRSTKLKNMTPERVAENAASRRLKAMNDVADKIGLPEAQRDVDSIRWDEKTAIVDGFNRPTDRTVRKLTRVEKLRNAGVLEQHEADACDKYSDVAELAWATTGCTANYGGMGSGNYVGATARAHMVNRQIADARDDYSYMAKAVPDQYRAIFEAVICHNASIASVGGERLSTLGRSQREHKTRAIVKLCANLVHGVIAHRLPISGAAVGPAVQPSEAVQISLTPRERISDRISLEVAMKAEATTILMSEDVLAALVRELGLDATPETYQGLAILRRPSWVWAWILQ